MFGVKFTIPTGISLCVKWSLRTGFAYKFWRFYWTRECVGEDFVVFADRAAGSGRSREGEGGVFVCPLTNRPARLVQHPARGRMDGTTTEQVSPTKEGEEIYRPTGLLEEAVERRRGGSCRQIYSHVFMTGHQTCPFLPLPVPSHPVSSPGGIRSELPSTDLERAGAAQRQAGRPVLRAGSDQLAISKEAGGKVVSPAPSCSGNFHPSRAGSLFPLPREQSVFSRAGNCLLPGRANPQVHGVVGDNQLVVIERVVCPPPASGRITYRSPPLTNWSTRGWARE